MQVSLVTNVAVAHFSVVHDIKSKDSLKIHLQVQIKPCMNISNFATVHSLMIDTKFD